MCYTNEGSSLISQAYVNTYSWQFTPFNYSLAMCAAMSFFNLNSWFFIYLFFFQESNDVPEAAEEFVSLYNDLKYT